MEAVVPICAGIQPFNPKKLLGICVWAVPNIKHIANRQEMEIDFIYIFKLK
jgi:hypothetical protein